VFTGLIQTLGTVHALGDHGLLIRWDSSLANVHSAHLWHDLAIGDSVAVDGICLTVTQILDDGFEVDASPETLARTTLGTLKGDRLVNLETSLRVGSKLGGHFVTGHIDGIGYLETAVQTATSWEISFTVTDGRVSRYIVPKGSIAVNGISLTVADCSATGDWFQVAVIPLTYGETNLQYLQAGDRVNLEGDVLGKYVEKFLRLGNKAPTTDELTLMIADEASHPLGAEISSSFLVEHGYL